MISRRLRRMRRHGIAIAGAGITLLVMAVAAALTLTANAAEARSNPPGGAPLEAQQITAPSLSIAAASDSVVEGGWAQFTISADPAPSGSLTVHYTVSLEGDFEHPQKYNWKDAHLGSKTVALSESSVTITVPTVDDGKFFSGDGSVTVALTAGSGYTLSASSSATVTLVENDIPPYVTISAKAGQVNEGSPAQFTISANPDAEWDTTVNYQVIQIGNYVASADLGDKTAPLPSFGAFIDACSQHWHQYYRMQCMKNRGFSGSSAGITVPTARDNAVGPDGVALVMLLPGDGYRLGGSNTAFVAVKNTDVPPPVPRLTISAAASQFEEGAPVRFTVSANPASSGSLAVDYKVMQTGDFVAAGDLGSKTLTLTGSSGTIAIPTVDDAAAESDGSALVALLPGDGYTLGRPNSAQARIWSNDAQLTEITVSGGAGITEGGNANYVFSANPSPQGSVTVHYTVAQNGAMVRPSDAGDKTLTLSGSRAEVTVPTVDDDVGEPDDSVTITVNDGAGYRTGSPGSASVPVLDDDGYPVVTMSAAVSSVLEGEVLELTFRASEPNMSHMRSMFVNYRVEGLRGLQNAELRSARFPWVQNYRYVTEVTDPVYVPIDGLIEPYGSLTITMLPGSEYQVGTTEPITVTVQNTDKEAETLTMSGPDTATEGDSLEYTFTASKAPVGGGVNIRYKVNVSSWGPRRVDAAELGIKNVWLNADEDEVSVTIPTTADDSIYDGDGTVYVTVLGAGGYVVKNPQISTTVTDDDPHPDVTVKSIPEAVVVDITEHHFQINHPEVTEGNELRFVIEADTAPAGSLPIRYKVIQEHGDVVAASELGDKTLTLTGTSATIVIPTLDDDVKERSSHITVKLIDGRGYKANGHDPLTGHAKFYVRDNDAPPPVPKVGVTGPSSVTEGSPITYTFTANPAPSGSLTVKYRVSHDEAVNSGYLDLSQLGIKTVTLTGGTATVSIPTNGDQVDELDGSVTVRIVDDSRDYDDDPANWKAITTVLDDDIATPEVTIAQLGTITEGDPAKFRIFADPKPTADLTVNVTVSQNGDFVAATGPQTVTIAKNSVSADLSVDTINDQVQEANGLVTVTVNAGDGYTVSTDHPLESVTVVDNDNPTDPIVSVTAGSDVVEGGDASFTIASNPAPTADLAVSVTVSQSGDFGATTGSQTVTIPTTGSVTLTVGTDNDTEGEADGSVTVTVNAGGDYSVSPNRGSASVNVADDDPIGERLTGLSPGEIKVSDTTPKVGVTAGGGVTEGGDASFTIIASPAPSANLDVNVIVSQSGDFGVTTGRRTVTIPPAGSVTLTVGTTNDDVDEADGSITVMVDAGDGYTMFWPQIEATVSVADDDVLEVSIIAAADVTEGGDATFTLTSSPPPAVAYDVVVTVSQSGDYGVATGKQTVTIPTTGRVLLEVSTTNDEVDEADGSVTATVNTGSGYTVSATRGAATVSVADDDDPAPKVEVNVTVEDASGTEGDVVEFRILLSNALTEEFEVNWYAGPASALLENRAHSSDYQTMSGTMVFEPGETALTGVVWLKDDDEEEPDEYFVVEAYLPGEWRTPASVGTMTIVDDD